MVEARGLLIVLVHPSPVHEEELNDWYDTEHLPERLILPGFRSAVRFVAVDQAPRYAALYDLESLAALDSPGYRAISGENFSPWTKRVTRLSKTTRIVAQQVHPRGQLIGPCRYLQLLCFGTNAAQDLPLIEEGLRHNFDSGRQACRYRLFRSDEPFPANIIVTIEFLGEPRPDPLDVDAFGAAAAKLELFTVFKPYKA